MRQKTNYDKVRDFQVAMEMPEGFNNRNVLLRQSLIREEADELDEEFQSCMSDFREYGHVTLETAARFTKEACDLLYVVYGAGVSFGIDLDAAFQEVHDSNMSKLGDDGKPVRREDGKVLKGPNYSPANMERFV